VRRHQRDGRIGRQEAIGGLLTHRNLEEAARAIDVAPNTLLRMQRELEFDAEYRQARRAAFGQTIERLQQGSSAAATSNQGGQ
jgi:hypothetical protein